MKELYDYIVEATDPDKLKRIHKFKKELGKAFEPTQVELQSHGGRFDKYWDILIHEPVTKGDIEKLNGIIKTMAPKYDPQEYNKRIYHVDNTAALVNAINQQLEEKLVVNGKPIPKYSWLYLRFDERDL